MALQVKEVETAAPVALGASTTDPEQARVKPLYDNEEEATDDDSDSEYTYEPGIINKRCCTICCTVLALITAVVCALYFTVGPEREQAAIAQGVAAPTKAPTAASTVAPTAAPTAPPTAAPTSQLFSDIMDLLLPYTAEETLFDSETPQGQALRQLVTEVEKSGGESIPLKILQRYALMTLYLSTNPAGWDTSVGWNSFTEDECEWYGIGTCRFLDDGSYGVSYIELGNNGLVGELPSEICAMAENLESVDMSGNQLGGSIPSCLKDFGKLKELNLSGNKFSGELPTGLLAISSMTVIDFSENQLEGAAKALFGSDTAATALSAVRLNDNRLTGGFPAVVTAYSMLDELQLHGNDMTGAVPQSVCALVLSTFTVDCDEKMTCSCCTECF